MAAVKGSKQHRMVVVPYRPFYEVVIFFVFIFLMVVFGLLIYEYGNNQGLELIIEVVRQKNLINKQ